MGGPRCVDIGNRRNGRAANDKQEVGQVPLIYQDQSEMKNERTISTKG